MKKGRLIFRSDTGTVVGYGQDELVLLLFQSDPNARPTPTVFDGVTQKIFHRLVHPVPIELTSVVSGGVVPANRLGVLLRQWAQGAHHRTHQLRQTLPLDDKLGEIAVHTIEIKIPIESIEEAVECFQGGVEHHLSRIILVHLEGYAHTGRGVSQVVSDESMELFFVSLEVPLSGPSLAIEDGSLQSLSKGFRTLIEVVLIHKSVGPLGQADFYLANPQAAFESRGKDPLPTTPSGTLFYTQIQAPVLGYTSINDDGQALIDQAESFQAPGYPSGWRLASLDELEQLRALALQANPNDVFEGLTSLGFSPPDGWEGDLWFPDYDNPYVTGPNRNYYLKVYDFTDGVAGGYDQTVLYSLIESEIAYIQVNYLPFDSSQTYEHIVAAGFRPTTAPQLTLSPDGTKVTAMLNGEDISQYCAWSSSSTQLEVRGLGEDAGSLVWHPGESPPLVSQTVTATIQGMDQSSGLNETLRASIDVPVPSPVPTRTVTSILLSPSNSILLNSSVATPFKAVAFYSDQSLEVVTSQVVWSLELPDGSPYPAGKATINGSVPGTLVFTGPILGDSTLVIKATLGSVTGTTQLEVATPF